VIAFYEATCRSFTFKHADQEGARGPAIDERYERLFARGIDPEDEIAARVGDAGIVARPPRDPGLRRGSGSPNLEVPRTRS